MTQELLRGSPSKYYQACGILRSVRMSRRSKRPSAFVFVSHSSGVSSGLTAGCDLERSVSVEQPARANRYIRKPWKQKRIRPLR